MLSVFHDNQSRQESVQKGMEVLIETRAAAGHGTLIIRAEISSAEPHPDTPDAAFQKGRFCLTFGNLRGFLYPNPRIRQRIRQDLKEILLEDALAMPFDEVVACLILCPKAISMIFAPVREGKDWFPREKDEGGGFRPLPAMFRSFGVGYMRVGDDLNRHGNLFMSLDYGRSFLHSEAESVDVVAARLGIDGALLRRYSQPPPAEKKVEEDGHGRSSSGGGGDSDTRGGEGKRHGRDREVPAVASPTSSDARRATSQRQQQQQFQRSDSRNQRTRGSRSGVPTSREPHSRGLGPGVGAGAGSKAHVAGATFGARPAETAADSRRAGVSSTRRKSYRGERQRIDGEVSTSHQTQTQTQTREPASAARSSRTARVSPVSSPGRSERRAISTGTAPGPAVISRSHLQELTAPLDFSGANSPHSAEPSTKVGTYASAQQPVPAGELQSRRRRHHEGRDRTAPEQPARASELTRAPAPAKPTKSDAQLFNEFLAHCKSRGFFRGCDKGTTEYNMKIQQVVSKFEAWKKSGAPSEELIAAAPVDGPAAKINVSPIASGGNSPHRSSSFREQHDYHRGGFQQERGSPGARAHARSSPRTSPLSSPHATRTRASPPRSSAPATATATGSAANDAELWQQFLQHAKGRGFFDGCDKGTQEYNMKVQQCLAKFEEIKAQRRRSSNSESNIGPADASDIGDVRTGVQEVRRLRGILHEHAATAAPPVGREGSAEYHSGGRWRK